MIPEPEFCQYQDLADELDVVSTRIKTLTGFLVWKGIYDASVDGENMLKSLADAGDGDFLPYENWAHLSDKGGIDKAVGFWPMEKIVPVLQMLSARQLELIQNIYQVTGISDIIRGSTDPRETKGAQQLKAQFGSMRLQKRQRDVQRFIRDLYRIKAEIIAEHFTSDNIAEMTQLGLPSRAELAMQQMMQQRMQPPVGPPQGMAQNMPLLAGSPPPAIAGPNGVQPSPAGVSSPPMAGRAPPSVPSNAAAQTVAWDDVMDILRSDKMRGYRIDIETDSTVMQDVELEKQNRVEFLASFKEALAGAYQAAISAPMMLPLIRESLLFLMRTYKAGRSMEQAVEDAFDELVANPPQPPPGEQAKPDTTEADQARLALDAKKLELEMQGKQGEAQYKQMQMGLEERKLQQESVLAERDFALRAAAQNKQLVDEATAEASQQQVGDAREMTVVEKLMEAFSQIVIASQQAQSNEMRNVVSQMGEQQRAEIEALVAAVTAPKRVVRDPRTGRAEGVETMRTMQ
jgi:hypothetical protein